MLEWIAVPSLDESTNVNVAKKKRTVIFVGGASYSGTTLIDMMLANNPDGFSCGELIALFHPHRKHHIKYTCGCGSPSCQVWPLATANGPSNVYRKLFDAHPELTYVVDSSKDPIWIHKRSKELESQGIEARHVLIWKTPSAFEESWGKRGRPQAWHRAWEHYHLMYSALISSWIAIPYATLIEDSESLRRLAEAVGISHHSGQEEYWEKTHHTLFGNSSAKIHLYGQNSEIYQECITDMAENQGTTADAVRGTPDSNHRTIYRNTGADPNLQGSAQMAMRTTEERILSVLQAHDLRVADWNDAPQYQITPAERLLVPLLYGWWWLRRRWNSFKVRTGLGAHAD